MGDAPHRPAKTMTAEEADALLPEVMALLGQLQELQRSIVRTNRQLDELAGKLATGNGFPIRAIREELQASAQRQLQILEAFQSALKRLEDLGVVLKDVAQGVVDFYSVRGDRLIFLCWKIGEPRIGFWHTLEEGYAGRRPLD